MDVPQTDAVAGARVVLPRGGVPMAELLARFPVALLSTMPR